MEQILEHTAETNLMASRSRIVKGELEDGLDWQRKQAASSTVRSAQPQSLAAAAALAKAVDFYKTMVGKVFSKRVTGMMGPDARYKVTAFNEKASDFEVSRTPAKAVFPCNCDQFCREYAEVVAEVSASPAPQPTAPQPVTEPQPDRQAERLAKRAARLAKLPAPATPPAAVVPAVAQPA